MGGAPPPDDLRQPSHRLWYRRWPRTTLRILIDPQTEELQLCISRANNQSSIIKIITQAGKDCRKNDPPASTYLDRTNNRARVQGGGEEREAGRARKRPTERVWGGEMNGAARLQNYYWQDDKTVWRFNDGKWSSTGGRWREERGWAHGVPQLSESLSEAQSRVCGEPENFDDWHHLIFLVSSI